MVHSLRKYRTDSRAILKVEPTGLDNTTWKQVRGTSQDDAKVFQYGHLDKGIGVAMNKNRK